MRKWGLHFLGLMLFLASSAIILLVGAYAYLSPKLPSVEVLQDIQLQVPLKVFSVDGKLIGEFGENKRTPITSKQTPDRLIQAILAAEDDRFYEHPGVDYVGLTRAALALVKTGEKTQGGSTITMQVARNFFLSREKTFLRKAMEVLLALKIEGSLSKQEILNLYINKIFLGHRSYGFAAAAQTYYGTDLNHLSLSQLATLAALPKAPSRFNPVSGPERAIIRRNYVLDRMHQLGYISDKELKESQAEPLGARLHKADLELDAHHAAEMVRLELLARYGEAAYTDGYEVFTTLDSQFQQSANQALQNGLRAYDQRHGYRGPVKQLAPTRLQDTDYLQQQLQELPVVTPFFPGVVLDATPGTATLLTLQGSVNIGLDSVRWARPHLSADSMGATPKSITEVLAPGDVIYLSPNQEGEPQLAQLPDVEGALVALDPNNGAIRALVGGFDFGESRFNRVTQADRQPGSNFKPCIYAAALSKGYSRASIVNDAPLVFDDDLLAGSWRPANYSGKFFGPTPLSLALANSRNLVAVRLLNDVGVSYGRNYCLKFGYSPEKLPRDLSLALGTGALPPLELARGYAVIASGGFRVEPYLIEKVISQSGKVEYLANPPRACAGDCSSPVDLARDLADDDQQILSLLQAVTATDVPRNTATRAIPAQDAYLLTTMLQDVIQLGTGRKARVLGRKDIAGKTGTTNGHRDAWFSGFNPQLVATVWVGFDTPRSLGRHETGARAALPIWIEFMRDALRSSPDLGVPQPPGLVSVRIDPATGQAANETTANAKFEIFRQEYAPTALEGAAESGVPVIPESERVTLF